MKLFVGIRSEKVDIYFVDSSDTTLQEVTLPNNINGASANKDDILFFRNEFSYEKIVIGMEFTSTYSFHPATFLSEDLELKSLKIFEVIVQNSKTIERYNKTALKEERYVALQRLTRSRYQMVPHLTECKQHFPENLYYKCNTLSKELDTSIFGATMLDILSDSLSLDDIVQMKLEDLIKLLQEKGCGGFSDPQKLAKTIKKAIRDSYRLGQVINIYATIWFKLPTLLDDTMWVTNFIIRKSMMKFQNLNTNAPSS